MSNSLKEAIKEFGRIVVLAVVPVLIAGLEGSGVSFKTVAIVGALALLRAIDRYLHKVGKEKGSDKLSLGLTRF